MTVLDDLSAEIFLQIFSLLPCRDLAAACLVSRRWLELGEQRLYTEVSFAAASLENFVTTITSRPGIATHVRSLDVKCKFALSTDFGVGLAQLQQLLPSLATIAILPPYNRSLRDPFPGGAAPTFQALREFTWHRHGDVTGLSARQLLMLLLLPSLRHLTAHMAPGPGMEALDSALLAPHFRTSGVTHLTLQHGNMTAGALTFVMHLPRALTHFSYSDAHLDPLGGWEVPMFRLALSCARETLESLTLGLCSALEDYQAWGVGGEGIGDLREWPVLTRVEASMISMLGARETVVKGLVDVLPKGVREVLVVRGAGDWEVGVADEVEKMVVSGALRSLEKVRIQGMFVGDRAREALRAVCDMAEVQLVIE